MPTRTGASWPRPQEPGISIDACLIDACRWLLAGKTVLQAMDGQGLDLAYAEIGIFGLS